MIVLHLLFVSRSQEIVFLFFYRQPLEMLFFFLTESAIFIAA